MAFRFRRSLKIAPGLSVNLGKRGASVSVGPRGARMTVGSKSGARVTAGIPGTGMSYTKKLGAGASAPDSPDVVYVLVRRMSFLLAIGIFFLPYLFAWLTLRQGYSTFVRVVSFSWLAFVVFLMLEQSKP